MKETTNTWIFCENIRRLRAKHHLSRKGMAKQLGISVYSLNLIEKGTIPDRLTCEVIFEVYRRFGISPKMLFSEIIEEMD